MDLPTLIKDSDLVVGDYQLKKLEELVDVFLEKSHELNLTSIKSDEEILVKHIVDSLILAKYISFRPKMSVLDLGTGGGFPGLPLAIPPLPTVFEIYCKKLPGAAPRSSTLFPFLMSLNLF